MWKRLISLSLTFGLAATAPPAVAQTSCAPHDVVSARLVEQYGEEKIGAGLQSGARLFEVWRSEETGSWTILALGPDGIACVMASGFAWTDQQPKMTGTKS